MRVTAATPSWGSPWPAPTVPRQSADLRIGDEARRAAAGELGQHDSAGRLTTLEFEDRLTATWSAITARDLEKVTGDLPALTSPPAHRDAADLAVRLHVAMYLLTMLLLTAIWLITPGRYFWPMWPALGWGLCVALHAVVTRLVLSSSGTSRAG